MDLFELNEAFAAQSLAVINELKLDKTKVLLPEMKWCVVTSEHGRLVTGQRQWRCDSPWPPDWSFGLQGPCDSPSCIGVHWREEGRDCTLHWRGDGYRCLCGEKCLRHLLL